MVTDKLEIIELVTKAKRGDRASLEKLVEAVEPRLRGYFLRVTLNEDVTDDLVQETLLGLLTSLKGLKDDRRFWGWLFRIASRQAINRFRKEKKQGARVFSGMPEMEVQELLRDGSKRPERELMRKEARQVLSKGIVRLKTRYREIISMRLLEGKSYRQICRLMGCTAITARTNVCRAKQELGRFLKEREVLSLVS